MRRKNAILAFRMLTVQFAAVVLLIADGQAKRVAAQRSRGRCERLWKNPSWSRSFSAQDSFCRCSDHGWRWQPGVLTAPHAAGSFLIKGDNNEQLCTCYGSEGLAS